MDDPNIITAEERQHCLDCVAANADRDIRKDAHRVGATPLMGLSEAEPGNDQWDHAANTINARRTIVSFTTRRSSFDFWASLGHLENLLSDYRRIAPRFTFMQLAGEPGIAAGNEYRLAITDANHLAGLDAACRHMAPDQDEAMFNGNRHMDVRVTRAGPWGGETGELVVEALENHALAGASAVWLVAHGETMDGNLRVTLDALEIARWAWAPDFLATHNTGGPASIVDWNYLFERLIQDLDGTPEPADDARSFERELLPADFATDDQIAEVLRSHSALSSIVRQIQTGDQTAQ